LGQYGNVNRRQAGLSLGNMPGLKANHHRSILVTHPISPLGGQLPLMNSPSSGNILHVSLISFNILNLVLKLKSNYKNIHEFLSFSIFIS